MIAREILATILSLEILHAEVHNAVVEVLTSQMRVTGSGLHFEDAILDREEGHIEGAATHVVNEDVAFAAGLLVKTICDGCCSGLVDDTEHIETSDGTSVFGGLALRVIEIRGHSHDSVVDFGAQVCLSSL